MAEELNDVLVRCRALLEGGCAQGRCECVCACACAQMHTFATHMDCGGDGRMDILVPWARRRSLTVLLESLGALRSIGSFLLIQTLRQTLPSHHLKDWTTLPFEDASSVATWTISRQPRGSQPAFTPSG